MRSPTNTANGHILKSLTVDVFYNFTPFIRPLIRNRKIKMPVSCQFHWPSKLSLLFLLFLEYSTWVRMWCMVHLSFEILPCPTGYRDRSRGGACPLPIIFGPHWGPKGDRSPPPPPPPYQRVRTLRSPQSTIGTLPFTLTVITTNRQILKLLAFIFVQFPWNQTFGCYYGPKTV